MNERIKLIELYEISKDSFTLKQRKYFEFYYFDDLSLSEISENESVSRSIVSKTINNIEKKLKIQEEILKKYENNKKLKELINK